MNRDAMDEAKAVPRKPREFLGCDISKTSNEIYLSSAVWCHIDTYTAKRLGAWLIRAAEYLESEKRQRK